MNRLPPYAPDEAQLRYEANKRLGEDICRAADWSFKALVIAAAFYLAGEVLYAFASGRFNFPAHP